MDKAYLHPYVGKAISDGTATIHQMLLSESALMQQFVAGSGQNGYPKDTCKNLWQPGTWMFVGKGAGPVRCLTYNWKENYLGYLDLHADVCSTTSLFDGSP